MANLLDNASRHGARSVRVGLRHTEGEYVIFLDDDGPGMPADRLASTQAALQRQKYDGHCGLGLMLADMVARAHGGGAAITPPSGSPSP